MKGKRRSPRFSHTSDLILVLVYGFLLGFTGLLLWVYWVKGGIPDTLVTCVFSAAGLETGVLGWIKTTKDKHGGKSNDNSQETGQS